MSDLEIDKARVLDFFQLFPHLISDIRLPRNLLFLRAGAKKFNPPFEFLGAPKMVMRSIGPIQLAAYASLAATGHVQAESFSLGVLRLGEVIRNPEISSALERYRAENHDLLAMLVDLSSVSLLGVEGLKARSNLLEYRYDAA